MRATTSRGGLGWYLEQIKSTPLLSAEEEKQLARRVQEHADPVARERMIRSNLRLVVRIAKDYTNAGMTLNDLVAEGNLGLMRAVEQFDPNAGVRFSTYAAWWIKQSIKRALINAGQPIHIPAYLAKLLRKWRRASAELNCKLGRPATTEEMARKLGISANKAQIVRQGLTAVNAPSQMGAEETQALAEVVADEHVAAPDQAMLEASNAPLIRSLLAHLEAREQQILELRFGLDGHDGPQRTYKEIGEMVGLTRERVRQLAHKALEQLSAIADDLM
ncbi:MAG: RNA polymerase sigma factor RpoD/SigA [Phycisphaerae bacterium]|nr:RNA polymerase sigma factor RpoD/SigA [Phycisphaerae bacterium]